MRIHISGSGIEQLKSRKGFLTKRSHMPVMKASGGEGINIIAAFDETNVC